MDPKDELLKKHFLTIHDIVALEKALPNDADYGREIRKIIKEYNKCIISNDSTKTKRI